MARDDMLTSGSKLRAGGIFEHFPVYRENIERDLRPREIRHHDDIVDRTAKLLIAHGGEILLGTNAAPFRILKVCHRGDIHQAPKAETVDAVSRLYKRTGLDLAWWTAVEERLEIEDGRASGRDRV